jgi:hypothetical protein
MNHSHDKIKELNNAIEIVSKYGRTTKEVGFDSRQAHSPQEFAYQLKPISIEASKLAIHPLCNAVAKNTWSQTSTSPYRFLMKHGEFPESWPRL